MNKTLTIAQEKLRKAAQEVSMESSLYVVPLIDNVVVCQGIRAYEGQGARINACMHGQAQQYSRITHARVRSCYCFNILTLISSVFMHFPKRL